MSCLYKAGCAFIYCRTFTLFMQWVNAASNGTGPSVCISTSCSAAFLVISLPAFPLKSQNQILKKYAKHLVYRDTMSLFCSVCSGVMQLCQAVIAVENLFLLYSMCSASSWKAFTCRSASSPVWVMLGESILLRHTTVTELYLHSVLSVCADPSHCDNLNTFQVIWESL